MTESTFSLFPSYNKDQHEEDCALMIADMIWERHYQALRKCVRREFDEKIAAFSLVQDQLLEHDRVDAKEFCDFDLPRRFEMTKYTKSFSVN